MIRRAACVVLVSSIVTILVLATGCGTGRFVQRGIDHYNRGDYARAAAQFDEIEAERYDLNPKGRVRFLAYRGLTFYKLGRMDLAARFLGEADVAYRNGDPAWLHSYVVEAMRNALTQLRSGAAPAGAPPAADAPPTVLPPPQPTGERIQ